jgi:hypothetical protein
MIRDPRLSRVAPPAAAFWKSTYPTPVPRPCGVRVSRRDCSGCSRADWQVEAQLFFTGRERLHCLRSPRHVQVTDSLTPTYASDATRPCQAAATSRGRGAAAATCGCEFTAGSRAARADALVSRLQEFCGWASDDPQLFKSQDGGRPAARHPRLTSAHQESCRILLTTSIGRPTWHPSQPPAMLALARRPPGPSPGVPYSGVH